MATVHITTKQTETARELKDALLEQIVTVRHAARAVADYAKADCGYTPSSMEWLTSNLSKDAHRLHDIWRDWFVADRRARGIPEPMLPAGEQLDAAE
ncbi:hypothetical protein ACKWRH_21185 [Bradyrhizobium sp. Pa8]|uniref:hypothetical protein n=1 Tax=Bradyrhizobium sp. Pa8 TaxID=3386552 RepID=UPI00403F40E1